MFIYCLLPCLFIYWASRETEKKSICKRWNSGVVKTLLMQPELTIRTFSNWIQQIVMQKMLLMLTEMQRLEQEFAVAVRLWLPLWWLNGDWEQFELKLPGQASFAVILERCLTRQADDFCLLLKWGIWGFRFSVISMGSLSGTCWPSWCIQLL